jgi:hypothetical protein
MIFKVLSEDPKSHLVICSAINMFGCEIIEDDIMGEPKKYGYFVLEGDTEAMDSLMFFPGITLIIEKK